MPEGFLEPCAPEFETLSMEETSLVRLYDQDLYPGWVACTKLVRRDIVESYPFTAGRVFEDNEAVTREQLAKILAVINNDTTKGMQYNEIFEDVSEDAWYYDSIKACFGAGIVKGADESHFGVGLSLTRQDACVMIYRIIADKAQYSSSQYADRAAVAEYAVEAVDALSAMQVINGMGNNRFEPMSTLTRAQAATIIYKVIENVISI